ncbi:hypothetical protein E2562_038774 [Oryza meyeriana var. granulata]|uniref:Uncharacterized protein n=1 Tax=Oryza meyeriana var. granulata TaxID=110450 RepID=A0A6G1CXU1_9ORYZ|nr:hypothetical protein E2562_038774 [Oryza meyeriana var. granulata]
MQILDTGGDSESWSREEPKSGGLDRWQGAGVQPHSGTGQRVPGSAAGQWLLVPDRAAGR